MNFLESAIPGVPSCGKLEVEWILQQLMTRPLVSSTVFIREAAKRFDSNDTEAGEWLDAALAKNREMRDARDGVKLVLADDVMLLRNYFKVQKCVQCEGKGGFMDTTYDRTGAWTSCDKCRGTGEIFDVRQVHELCLMRPRKPK